MTNPTNEPSSSPKRRPRRLVLIGVVVVVVALIAALAVWLTSGRDDSQDDAAAPEQTTEGPQPDASGENTPGAQLNSDQRSWPDPTGYFDDSQWATPGEYSVDPWHSRPVFTPYDADGDLPDRGDLTESMDSCTDDTVRLDGTTQQQYVNARFLTVNSQAGPTTMNDSVPGGYAHSPQGAIVAALNQMSYGMYGQGDEVGEEIDNRLWGTSDSVQEELSNRLPAEERDLTTIRPDSIPGPWAYEVDTCSENIMVIDVATKQPEGFDEGDTDFSVRVTMVWNDGDWIPDFSGNSDQDMSTPRPVDVNDHTEVQYQ